MIRLLIFAITMLALSGICNGQARSSFGATRAQDTSFTAAQLKLSAYAGSSDTMQLVVLPNGTVKKVAMLGVDTLSAYMEVVTPEQFLSSAGNDTGLAVQYAINYIQGVREVSYIAGNVTLDSVAPARSAILYLHSRVYRLTRGLVKNVTHPTLGTRFVNSQLYIPLISQLNSNTQYNQISIVGEAQPNFFLNYLTSRDWPLATNETILYSTISNDGSYQPAMLRAVPGDTLSPFGVPIAPNLTKIHLKNLTFRAHHDATTGVQLCGADLYFTPDQTVEYCRFESDTDNYYTVTPTYKVYALRTGATGTSNTHFVTNCLFTGGYYYGSVLYEHAFVQNGIYGVVKIPFEIGTANYKIDLDNCLIVASPYKISTGDFVLNPANTASSLYGSLRIEDNRTSVSGKWYSSTGRTDIVDSLNTLRGELDIEMTIDGTPAPSSLRFNGAKNLQVHTPTKYIADTVLTTGLSRNYMAALGINFIARTTLGALLLSSESTNGAAWFFFSGNRPNPVVSPSAAALAIGTPSSGYGSLFGRNVADVSMIINNGTLSRGILMGTLTSDSLWFGTNSVIRAWFMPAGGFGLAGKITTYNNSAPTNGQLLIGHTANGTFEASTLAAGSGMSVTNGAGSITIATNGDATVTTTSAGTFAPSASGHYVFTGTTSTWTLPAVSGTSGRVMFIKNRGSGTVTINATASANEIYSNAAVNTYALTAGSAIILVSDGSFYNVE